MSNFEPVTPGAAFQAEWTKWQKQLREWRQSYDDWCQVIQQLQEWDEKESKGVHGQLASIDPNFDVFAVENIMDIGEGEPLFGNFEYEDWLLLCTKVELHLLVHHFRDDTGGAILDESNMRHYFKMYFRKELKLDDYGAKSCGQLLKLVQDTVYIQNDGLLDFRLPEDTPFIHFLKMTEQSRRERVQALEAGDETVDLKFPGAEKEREAKKKHAARKAKESQPPLERRSSKAPVASEPPALGRDRERRPPERHRDDTFSIRRRDERDRNGRDVRDRYDERDRYREPDRYRDERDRNDHDRGYRIQSRSRDRRDEYRSDRGNIGSRNDRAFESDRGSERRAIGGRCLPPAPPAPPRDVGGTTSTTRRTSYPEGRDRSPRRSPPRTAFSVRTVASTSTQATQVYSRDSGRSYVQSLSSSTRPPAGLGSKTIQAAPPPKLPDPKAGRSSGKGTKGYPRKDLDPLDAFMAGMEQHGEAFATGEVNQPKVRARPQDPVPRNQQTSSQPLERRNVTDGYREHRGETRLDTRNGRSYDRYDAPEANGRRETRDHREIQHSERRREDQRRPRDKGYDAYEQRRDSRERSAYGGSGGHRSERGDGYRERDERDVYRRDVDYDRSMHRDHYDHYDRVPRGEDRRPVYGSVPEDRRPVYGSVPPPMDYIEKTPPIASSGTYGRTARYSGRVNLEDL